MKQYREYNRKRYEKYDKPLDEGDVNISAADQEWLKNNKTAYQLDLVKDTLGKRNTIDIKDLL